MLNEIVELARKRPDAQIRLLCPTDGVRSMQDVMNRKNIQFRYLEGSLQSLVSILIVDDKLFISTESKPNAKLKNGGIATYSNSRSTALSYISIFNALWKQSDLYQQIKENNFELHHLNEIQKDFINIARS